MAKDKDEQLDQQNLAWEISMAMNLIAAAKQRLDTASQSILPNAHDLPGNFVKIEGVPAAYDMAGRVGVGAPAFASVFDRRSWRRRDDRGCRWCRPKRRANATARSAQGLAMKVDGNKLVIEGPAVG